MPILAVSKKRGTTGVVYLDGDPIGKVTRQQRRLRNTGGQHGTAYTANYPLPPHTFKAHSGREITVTDRVVALGTRYTSPLHAARALRAFHATLRPGMTYMEILQAASRFKYDHPELCGLTRRYRGADPRRWDR